MPPFDQALVGKWIEVLWRYTDKATNKPMLIWSRGRISRVADGLADTRSPRAKTVLPLGAVLWEWEADPEFEEPAGERWLFLHPNKWNPSKPVQYGWRYDPCELEGSPRTPQHTPCPRNMRDYFD